MPHGEPPLDPPESKEPIAGEDYPEFRCSYCGKEFDSDMPGPGMPLCPDCKENSEVELNSPPERWCPTCGNRGNVKACRVECGGEEED